MYLNSCDGVKAPAPLGLSENRSALKSDFSQYLEQERKTLLNILFVSKTPTRID